MSQALAGNPSLRTPGSAVAVSNDILQRLQRSLRICLWSTLASGIASAAALFLTFWFTLHYLRSAVGSMPGDAGGMDEAIAPLPAEQLHAHTSAAVASLSTGLALFVVILIAFMCFASCYISTRARIAEAEKNATHAERLASEMVAEADRAREEQADEAIARQLGVGPYAASRSPAADVSPDDADRFRNILERPGNGAAEA